MIRTLIALVASTATAMAQDAAPTVPSQPAAADKLVFVKMSTTAGDIILELNNEKAPISVANFLKYADSHAYDGTVFHRVIPFFVIQGGGYTTDLKELKGEPAIKNEWTNGLKNTRGTIAMARDSAPDTATREFYINVADNARLDTARSTTGNAGYAVFGRVISGMDAVDAIRDGVTGSRPDPDPEKSMDDLPAAPFAVIGVTRISAADAQVLAAAARPGRPPWKLWRLDEPANEVPTGFTPSVAGANSTPPQWRVSKPVDPLKPTSPPGALYCTASGSGDAFNVLLSDDAAYRDVTMTVKIHAQSGKEDQGGGLMWRAKDAANGYIARWNPLESNVRVYSVKAGKRTQLGSATVKADPSEWHRIRIDHTGTTIVASFDGKSLITVEDSTFTDAGRIGLWTKADACTWFDDLAACAR